jgi:rhamnogalacturonan endolyase
MILPASFVRVVAAATILLPIGGAELFRDDFSKFPPGWLSSPVGQLNGAIQEYHYLANRGVPLGPWENAICHQDAWIVSDENGKPYLEQQLDKTSNMFTNALFITGDTEWSDYTVEAKVRPLSLDDVAGVVFRYPRLGLAERKLPREGATSTAGAR